jgi:hypothetical protein
MTRKDKMDFIYDCAKRVDDSVVDLEIVSDVALDELVEKYKHFYKEY